MFYRLEELTWPQAAEVLAKPCIALIPIGSLEQHGHHLPLNVDNVLCDEIAEAAGRLAGEALDIVLCPPIHYGYTMHNMDFPGTITLEIETLVALGVDVCRSLIHHGCKKIVFVSTHGSNFSVLDIVSRKVMNLVPDALVAVASPVKMSARELEELREAKKTGGMSHGGELETSILLHFRPDLVDMGKAVEDINQPESQFYFRDVTRGSRGVALADLTRHVSKTGVVGDPTVATAEKGRVFFDIIVKNLAAFLEEFSRREVVQVAEIELRHPRTQLPC